jgi:hypothetical protein
MKLVDMFRTAFVPTKTVTQPPNIVSVPSRVTHEASVSLAELSATFDHQIIIRGSANKDTLRDELNVAARNVRNVLHATNN